MNALRCPWTGNDPLYRRYHDEEWEMEIAVKLAETNGRNVIADGSCILVELG